MFDELVVVRGGGDLGTGAAIRLWRAGFSVLVLEIAHPVAVRRSVAFSEAAYDGRQAVEEAACVRVESLEEVRNQLKRGTIPLLVDPSGQSIFQMQPSAVVDAILAKRNLGTRMEMAPVVVGLGPGFCAGRDVHAVVETNRGPDLGRVVWQGEAEANTGLPAPVAGHAADRVLRAPVTGTLTGGRVLGQVVHLGDTVCHVDGIPVPAPFTGLVRGLLRDGSEAVAETKIGDLDPRLDLTLVHKVSDKALAVAGGVLEAVLAGLHGRVIVR